MPPLKYTKEQVQEALITGRTIKKASELLKSATTTIRIYIKKFNIDYKATKNPTPEMKAHLSAKRKAYLKANPDKHPWRNSNKFKSAPCEKVKDFLRGKNIDFCEEYLPNIEGRNFSIDIAFPKLKIGLEINGNQHYNRDGTLKEYYQIRNDEIEKGGWKLYQLHYSICFNINKLEDLFKLISENKDLPIFHKNIKSNLTQDILLSLIYIINAESFCKCGKVKTKKSKSCINCHSISQRLHPRPEKEELKKLIKTTSILQIAKKFNVSDNAIRRWCNSYSLKLKKNKKRNLKNLDTP